MFDAGAATAPACPARQGDARQPPRLRSERTPPSQTVTWTRLLNFTAGRRTHTMACAHSELSTGHCGRRYGTKIFQDDSCSPSTRPRCKLSCPRPCHIEPAYARLVAYTAGIVRRGAKWHAAVNLKLFEVQARVEIQGTPQPEDPMVQGVHTQTLSASMLSCVPVARALRLYARSVIW